MYITKQDWDFQLIALQNIETKSKNGRHGCNESKLKKTDKIGQNEEMKKIEEKDKTSKLKQITKKKMAKIVELFKWRVKKNKNHM